MARRCTGFSSIQVIDKTSLSVMVAQQMAKDPHFGFGRDQRPYRWVGNRWEAVDKWFASIRLLPARARPHGNPAPGHGWLFLQ